MVGKLTPDDIATASIVPAIMGYSRYKTRNDTLADAIAAMNGKVREWTSSEPAEWGNRLEGIIIAEAARRLNLSHLVTEFDTAYFHPSIKLACSLDGTAVGDGAKIRTNVAAGVYCMTSPWITLDGKGIIESKLTSAQAEENPPLSRGPLQLQAQMLCTGLKWGVVATLYRGTELRLFVYEEDKEMQDRIIDAVNEFEQRKINCDWYPSESPSDAASVYVNPEDDLPPIDLANSVDGEQALAEYLDSKAMVESAEQRLQHSQTILMDIMALHKKARGFVGNKMYEVTWPTRSYKAQPEKIVPAKPAHTARTKTLSVKEV